MEIIAERLRALRGTVNLSQAKLAQALELRQSAVNRYENNQSDPSYETLLRYADFFDVSMDYIFGRTDDPHGRVFQNQPNLEQGYPEMEQFIEMCFDPKSPMNQRLKETMLRLLKENDA